MKRIKKSAEEKLSQQIKFSLPSDQKGNSSANKPEKCPKCGSAKVVPIVYGEPSPELARKAFYKEIYLGGCCMVADAPNPLWMCLDCENEIYLKEC